MKPNLWRLPGPTAWLKAVLDDFDDGAFIVVRLPRTWSGAELMEAVHEARPTAWLEPLELSDSVSLAERLMASAYGAASVDEALERFNADGTVPWLRVDVPLSAEELAALAEAHGRVAATPARAVVIEHVGALDSRRRATAPTLRVHTLYGVLSTLDTLVLLHEVAPGLSRVRREEVAELAGHDLHLAAELAANTPASRDRDIDACRARAVALGIEGQSPSLPEPAQVPVRQPGSLEQDWQSGAVDRFDEQPTVHPGIAHIADIERRLWRAQVRGMLPFLDEMRLAVYEATRKRGMYVVPGRGDTVELIDLLRALEHRGTNEPLTRAARELTRARNDLAHLRLVDEQRRQRLSEYLRRARLDGWIRM